MKRTVDEEAKELAAAFAREYAGCSFDDLVAFEKDPPVVVRTSSVGQRFEVSIWPSISTAIDVDAPETREVIDLFVVARRHDRSREDECEVTGYARVCEGESWSGEIESWMERGPKGCLSLLFGWRL